MYATQRAQDWLRVVEVREGGPEHTRSRGRGSPRGRLVRLFRNNTIVQLCY